MTKEDFEELLEYTNIANEREVAAAIGAGFRILEHISTTDIKKLANDLFVTPTSVRQWLMLPRSPRTTSNRKYMLAWLLHRMKEE